MTGYAAEYRRPVVPLKTQMNTGPTRKKVLSGPRSQFDLQKEYKGADMMCLCATFVYTYYSVRHLEATEWSDVKEIEKNLKSATTMDKGVRRRHAGFLKFSQLYKSFPAIREPKKLFSTCGMANHSIEGTFFVSFRNCSITSATKPLKTQETTRREPFQILPMFNVTIKQRNIEPLVEMHELYDLHIKNRKKLELVHFMQEQDKKTSYAVIIAIIIIAVVIGLCGYMVIKFRSFMPSVAINMPEPSRDVPELRGEKLRL